MEAIGPVYPTKLLGFGTTVTIGEHITRGCAPGVPRRELPAQLHRLPERPPRRLVPVLRDPEGDGAGRYNTGDESLLAPYTALERARCATTRRPSRRPQQRLLGRQGRLLEAAQRLGDVPAPRGVGEPVCRAVRRSSLAGRNLLTWTDFVGTDPEVEDFTDRAGQVSEGAGEIRQAGVLQPAAVPELPAHAPRDVLREETTMSNTRKMVSPARRWRPWCPSPPARTSSPWTWRRPGASRTTDLNIPDADAGDRCGDVVRPHGRAWTRPLQQVLLAGGEIGPRRQLRLRRHPPRAASRRCRRTGTARTAPCPRRVGSRRRAAQRIAEVLGAGAVREERRRGPGLPPGRASPTGSWVRSQCRDDDRRRAGHAAHGELRPRGLDVHAGDRGGNGGRARAATS